MRQGEVLDDRFEIGPLLGSGGSADVHAAWDRVERIPVAVKLYVRPARLHRYEDEVSVLAALDHPGIVALLGTGLSAGRPFAVLQLVDGPSLREHLMSGPLHPRDVALLGARLGNALAHVHAKGLVHRDVKPGNVLLDHHGHPRLADFGLARLVEGAGVTATGNIVGTAAYMAPEQVRGRDVGAAADVYSLGLVLLEAVTGRREFDGDMVESAVARLHRDPRVPPTVPHLLAEVLVELTAPQPAWRPTAAGASSALIRVAADLHRPARAA